MGQVEPVVSECERTSKDSHVTSLQVKKTDRKPISQRVTSSPISVNVKNMFEVTEEQFIFTNVPHAADLGRCRHTWGDLEKVCSCARLRSL